MFNISLRIRNPYFKTDEFRNILVKHGQFTSHKFWELQILYNNYYWVELLIDASIIEKDHAGIEFKMTLFGFTICYTVYDDRHWDDDSCSWREYETEESNRT